MSVFLNEWAIRLCRSAAIAIAICFGFLLGWYYCERNVIFDDIKRGIWANEQAIQNNTKLIHELYKKHGEAEHK